MVYKSRIHALSTMHWLFLFSCARTNTGRFNQNLCTIYAQTMIETVVCCIFYNMKVMMMKIIKYKGPYTNYVDKHGVRGFAKCLLCYYISLCSKLVYGGRRGVKNLQNLVYIVCVWSLMPFLVYFGYCNRLGEWIFTFKVSNHICKNFL